MNRGKAGLLLGALLLVGGLAAADDPSGGEAARGSLTVVVPGLASNEGKIIIALFDSAEDFEKGDAFVRSAFVEPENQGAVWTFGDLPFGEYAFRLRGESHVWQPDIVADLQHAVRGDIPEKYRTFAKQVNDQAAQLMTLRGLFRLRPAEEMGRQPVPLDEVEPTAEIVKRFATGAMSFGSISREAHTTLAMAMNRIGGKSNTGEGGEEPDRFLPMDSLSNIRSTLPMGMPRNSTGAPGNRPLIDCPKTAT